MPLSKTVIPMLSLASINPSTVSNSGSTTDLTTPSVMLSVTVTLIYANAGVIDPAVLEIYSSVDGIVYDTIPFMTATIPVKDGGGTQQLSINIPASPNFVKAEVRNNDSGTAVTDVVVTGVKTDAS